MIIGSRFSRKHHRFLRKIGEMSEGDSSRKISVQELNDSLDTDRTEMKNVLEHLRELGFINIETIGGPLLYGHISITAAGLRKYNDI